MTNSVKSRLLPIFSAPIGTRDANLRSEPKYETEDLRPKTQINRLSKILRHKTETLVTQDFYQILKDSEIKKYFMLKNFLNRAKIKS